MTTFAQSVQNASTSIVSEAEKKAAEALAKARAQANQEAILQVLGDKVTKNPNLTLGDLLAELRSARKTTSDLKQIPLKTLAEAIVNFGKPTQTVSIADKFLPLFLKNPSKSWTSKEIQAALNCTQPYVYSLVTSHLNSGNIVKDANSFRLNLVPARESILSLFPSRRECKTRDEILDSLPGVKFVEVALDKLLKDGFLSLYAGGKIGKN